MAISRELPVATLPNLCDRPSFEELCNALEHLAIKPTNWTGNASQVADADEVKDVNDYLFSVISSGLKWIKPTDPDNNTTDPKEVLWDLASRRMAERCGRTAMPEMTRSWVVAASPKHPELRFEIREPPFAGDNLGLKTWGTAFAISKNLESLGDDHFSHLINNTADYFTSEAGLTLTVPKVRALELGSGTGLVGIATATLWKVPVVLTDLPEIQENLEFNVKLNLDTIQKSGGIASCSVLDWKSSDSALQALDLGIFEIVIAADPLYDDDHPELVAKMIHRYLKYGENSRALVAVPMRDRGTQIFARRCFDIMESNGFLLSAQGEEVFKDDWADPNDEGVDCWWTIWSWHTHNNSSNLYGH